MYNSLGLPYDDGPRWFRYSASSEWYKEYRIMHSNKTRTKPAWSKQSRDAIQPLLREKLCIRKRKLEPGVSYFEDNIDDTSLTFIHTFDNLLSPNDLPGRKQTAKTQCELKLHDENATVVTFDKICKNLECETRLRGSYFAGRALNGMSFFIKLT